MPKRVQTRAPARTTRKAAPTKRKSPGSRTQSKGNARSGRRSNWDERYVLSADTKTSRVERQHRREASTKLALKAGAIIIFFIALIAGARSVLDRTLRQGDGVILSELDVHSDGSLTREKILHVARVAEGENLLDLDLDGIQERLEELPQVASANVMRRIPGRLLITLEERKPLAWLSCPLAGVLSHTAGGGYLLDTEGNIFKCEAVLQDYVALPVIHVQEPGVIRDGAKAEGAELRSAINLLQLHLEKLPVQDWRAKEVEIVGTFKLRVHYYNDAIVTFGMADLDRQVNDLSRIVHHASKIDKDIETANLIPERNIPVTYFDFKGGDVPRIREAGQSTIPVAPYSQSHVPVATPVVPAVVPIGAPLETATPEIITTPSIAAPQAAPESERSRQIRGILGDD